MNHNDEILLDFLKKQKSYTSIDEICDSTHLSRRTIYNCLDRIEDHFRDRSISYRIHKKYGEGIKLEIFTNSVYDKTLSLIIIDLLNDNLKTISSIMSSYNLSYYSANKYLLEIKNIFDSYKINLDIREKIGIIIDDEFSNKYDLLRDLLIKSPNDKIFDKLFHKILDKIDVNKINSIIYVFSIKYNIDKKIHKLLKAHIYYLINKNLDDSEAISDSHYHIYAVSIINLMKVHYKISQENELANYLINLFKEIDLRSYFIYDEGIILNANNFINLLKDHLSYTNNTYLFDSKEKEELIRKHLLLMFSRIKKGERIDNPVYDDIIKKQAFYFNEIMNVSEDFSDLYNINIPLYEIAYIVIYILSFEKDSIQKQKAVIVSDFRGGLNQYLKTVLEANLNQIDFEKILTHKEFVSQNFDDYLVFSTIDLGIADYFKIPISNDNSFDIRDLKKDVYIENKFINILNKDSSRFDLAIDSKYDILKYIADMLFEKDLVDENYFESLVKREELESTEIGKKFALVHGNQKYIRKSSLSFIKLSKPIKWKVDTVQYIFVIAAKSDDYSKYSMKEFFKIINLLLNNDDIETVNNYEDLVNLFFKYILWSCFYLLII